MDKMTRCLRMTLSVALTTIWLVGQSNVALADANGRAGRSGASGSTCGGGCHSGGTVPTLAFASGGVPFSATTAVAGSVNTYTFTVSGGPGVTAGLGVKATSGALGVTGSTTKILSTEVVHSAPTPFVNGSVVYTFTWTAPATAGSVTLFGAGVSSNGDNATKLDGAAAIVATITVTGSTGGGGVNAAPIATFTAPATATVGSSVSFDASASTDSDGSIATYTWDFGDNSAGAGVNPPHSYAAVGTYTVKLVVTDNLGATGTSSQNIAISAIGTRVAPFANAGGPYSGTVVTEMLFNGSQSTVSSGLTATYDWNFGDGTATVLATGPQPAHIYSQSGTYIITLQVTDSGTPPLSSTATSSAVITGGTTPGGDTGQQLYDNNCASCHGPKGGPPGPDGAVSGTASSSISLAIQVVPVMQSLSTLSAAEIDAISTYLGPSSASVGQQLYDAACASCHGPNGIGGPDGNVAGTSAASINTAIQNVPEMQSLNTLSLDQISSIANFLNPTTQGRGELLYNADCASCHGPGGTGGDAKAIVGADAEDITKAIKDVPDMASLAPLLDQPDVIDAIAAFLGGGGNDDDDLSSKPKAPPKTNATPAAGALDWLSLFGVGAWGLSRRRRK